MRDKDLQELNKKLSLIIDLLSVIIEFQFIDMPEVDKEQLAQKLQQIRDKNIPKYIGEQK